MITKLFNFIKKVLWIFIIFILLIFLINGISFNISYNNEKAKDKTIGMYYKVKQGFSLASDIKDFLD